MTGRETIILILGIFIAFPKLIYYLVLSITLGALFYFGNQSRKKSIHNAINIDMKYDLQICPKQYPLRVIIKNNSKKVIHKVEWTISAYKPGYSNDICEDMHPEVYRILKKGDTYETCYKLPKFKEPFPPQLAIYDASYKHIELDNGECIYQSDAE